MIRKSNDQAGAANPGKGGGLAAFTQALRGPADPLAAAERLRADAQALIERAMLLEARADGDDQVGALTRSARFFERTTVDTFGENPASGAEISPGLKLFHDASLAELGWSQRPVGIGRDRRFALSLTCYRFDGSFLSLVVDLAAEELSRLATTDMLSLAFELHATRPLKVFLRLNLYRDGVQETLHDAMIVRSGAYRAMFDLSALEARPREGTSAWIDIIFTQPEMTAIEVTALQLRTDGRHDA